MVPKRDKRRVKRKGRKSDPARPDLISSLGLPTKPIACDTYCIPVIQAPFLHTLKQKPPQPQSFSL
jgi:hypothetical protein